MINEHLELAKKIIKSNLLFGDDIMTIYSASKAMMEMHGMTVSPYNTFMVGRYVGELIQKRL